MKKITSLIIAVILLVGVLTLAGCDNKEPITQNNVTSLVINDDFTASVSMNSPILGKWKEISGKSVADEYTWFFMKSTTVHFTENFDGVLQSNVCNFKFNDETGELSYYVYREDKVYDVIVKFKGDKMFVSSTEGEELYTFERID